MALKSPGTSCVLFKIWSTPRISELTHKSPVVSRKFFKPSAILTNQNEDQKLNNINWSQIKNVNFRIELGKSANNIFNFTIVWTLLRVYSTGKINNIIMKRIFKNEKLMLRIGIHKVVTFFSSSCIRIQVENDTHNTC